MAVQWYIYSLLLLLLLLLLPSYYFHSIQTCGVHMCQRITLGGCRVWWCHILPVRYHFRVTHEDSQKRTLSRMDHVLHRDSVKCNPESWLFGLWFDDVVSLYRLERVGVAFASLRYWLRFLLSLEASIASPSSVGCVWRSSWFFQKHEYGRLFLPTGWSAINQAINGLGQSLGVLSV